MLPEQQQRIMGYFIEEAKDHLNTIEQGLLSLQATIEDPEKANEVFRAAHSVKGGAAMLGLESIQKTAHRMEDYFKVLKESPVQVDRVLETMFLRTSDGLKDLLEELEGPFGLTQDKAKEIMADVEPVFGQLEAHLNSLVANAGGGSAIAKLSEDAVSPDALKASFKRDVASLLRQMLTAFKQPDTSETRKTVQSVCVQLTAIGEQFELAAWCDLIETARIASANLDNDYRALAPVLIKEIKKAQDLVLSGRASEVSVCDAMQALLPEDILATESDGLSSDSLFPDDVGLEDIFGESVSDDSVISDADESIDDLFLSEVKEIASATDLAQSDLKTDDLLATDDFLLDNDIHADDATVGGSDIDDSASVDDSLFSPSLEADDDLGGLFGDGNDVVDADVEIDTVGGLSFDLDFDEIPVELSTLNRNVDSEERADESMDALLATVNVTGPDVGTEELNSLADLFDGDLDELDNTLGGHAFASEEMQLNPEKIDLSVKDDLIDLLEEASFDETPSEIMTADMDDDLFGGTLSEGEFASVGDSLEAVDSELASLEGNLFDESGEDDLFDESEAVETQSNLSQSNIAVDMALLSEDVWSEESAPGDVDPGGIESGDSGPDGEMGYDSDDNLFEDISSLGLDTLDIDESFDSDIDSIGNPDLDLSPSLQGMSADGTVDSPVDDDLLDAIANDDLDSDDLDIEETAFDGGLIFDENVAADADIVAESEPVAAEGVGTDKGSSQSLDIEFPTLSGVKLQEAEEAIDSFFLDVYTDKSVAYPVDSVDGLGLDDLMSESATPLSNSQLANDPWGELSIDETASSADTLPPADLFELDEATAESDIDESDVSPSDTDLDSDFLDGDALPSDEPTLDSGHAEPDQVEGQLNDLFKESLDVDINSGDGLAPDADNLWEEMATPIALTDSDLGSAEDDSDLLSDLLGEDEQRVDSQLGLDNLSVGEESFDVAVPSDLTDTLDGARLDSNDDGSSVFLDSADSGEDLSDDVLAEFETAFGTQSSEAEGLSVSDRAVDSESSLTIEEDAFLADDIDLIDEINLEGSSDSSDGETLLEHDLLDSDLLDSTLLTQDRVGDVAEDESAGNSLLDEATTKRALDDDLLGLNGPDLALEDLSLFDASESRVEEPNAGEFSVEEPSAEAFLFEEGGEVSEEENLAEAFDDDFDDLESLLSEESEESAEAKANDVPTYVGDDVSKQTPSTPIPAGDDDDDDDDNDFGDLERLLEDGDTDAATPSAAPRRAPQRAARRGGGVRDQNMRVSVKHLDNLSNLVGELVVSRNTLERDQERLRQFLDNLLFQVQQLNDVGQRMRDLYERSLLESSLVSNHRAHSSTALQGVPTTVETVDEHATGETFDALEMDRFTGFHTLSQEMIELIVRVRESSSDIGYTVESSDQVTRQFRQITTQLQEGLNTARMVAFSQAADRLPRAVRDISLKCGKEARLIVEGQDTLIDKMIVEHLYDPLTHLVNNAITHGVETPEARRAAGKLPEGAITVRAFYQGNQTVIYVADDGGGINTDFVKQKAIEKQLITQAEADGLSDIEIYDLLFHPGFSTRDQADDFAGRGVGMDVVRTSLAEIRGSVTIDSELGKGTSFTIRLPLTLSISKALSCVSNQARLAFPMDGVEDMLDVPRDRVIQNEEGQDCVRWRDKVLPFQPVTNLLKFNRTLGRGRVYGGSQDDDVLSVIVLRSANTFVAVQVDQVIGEQEIVIKQLEGPVPKPLGIAGATVLGDGRVMPIADVLELIDIAMGRVRREPTSSLWADAAAAAEAATPVKNDPTVLIVDDSITVRELLSMSFNKVGYRVEQARDGQEAWDKLRSGLPCDLVFCDIEMPRMDGLELLSRMQKDNHLKSIPIAMLTSRGADRHRQMAVDLGASGYFTKPYLEEALLDAAQRMLNGETLAKGRGG